MWFIRSGAPTFGDLVWSVASVSTVVEEAAYVYLFQAKYRVALRRVVKGFIFNPMLEYIYNLDTIHKDSGQ